MYKGGALFTDVHSGVKFPFFQVTFTTEDTLRGKATFEHYMLGHGIKVENYVTDAGVFTSAEFTQYIIQQGQHIFYAGPGAHHHNPIAERSIKTVTYLSRASLIHAMIHWPQVIRVFFWPMLVQYTCEVDNHIPDPSTGLAPMDRLSRTKFSTSCLTDFHVWGCPTYVLHPRLQDGLKLPRWEPRSKRGVFVGMSARYASTVPLILNLQTGSITAQFHVVFDDKFTTVPSITGLTSDEPEPGNWEDLCINSRFQTSFDIDDPPHLNQEWLNEEERQLAIHRIRQMNVQPPPIDIWDKGSSSTTPAVPVIQPIEEPPSYTDHPLPSTPSTPAPSTTAPSTTVQPSTPARTVEGVAGTTTPIRLDMPTEGGNTPIPSTPVATPYPTVTSTPASVPMAKPTSVTATTPAPPPLHRSERLANQASARPQRERNPPKWMSDYQAKYGKHAYYHDYLTFLASAVFSTCVALNLYYDDEGRCLYDPSMGTLDLDNPLAFMASLLSADPLSWRQAMAQSDAAEFVKFAKKEIQELEGKKVWRVIPRSQVPKGKKVFRSTWSLKRKMHPLGHILKHKGRFCFGGDQQVLGLDAFDTAAPVGNWSSLRLLLILTFIKKWHVTSTDYVNAFVQASLPKGEEKYIELPEGFVAPDEGDFVLELLHSLYGDREAPRRWFVALTTSMKKIGFKESKYDPCLYFHPKKKVFCFIWVDDCLFFGPDKKTNEEVIAQLSKLHHLQINSELEAYLGISVK